MQTIQPAINHLQSLNEIKYLAALINVSTFGQLDLEETNNYLEIFREVSPEALEKRGYPIIAKASKLLKRALSNALSLSTAKLDKFQVEEMLQKAWVECKQSNLKDHAISYLNRFSTNDSQVHPFTMLQKALFGFSVLPSQDEVKLIIKKATSEYLTDCIDEAIKQLEELKNNPEKDVSLVKSVMKSLDTEVCETAEKIGEKRSDCLSILFNYLDRMKSSTTKDNFSIGVKPIDEDCLKNEGISRKKSVLLAAPPGAGKTAVMVKSFTHQIEQLAEEYKKADLITDQLEKDRKLKALKRRKVVFFSTEMSEDEIFVRVLQSATKSFGTLDKYLTPELGTKINDFAERAIDVLANNVFIYGPEVKTVEQIIAKCEEMHKTGDLALVYIDYMQNIQTEKYFSQEFEKIKYVGNALLEFKNLHSNAAWILASSCNELTFDYNGANDPNLVIRGSKDLAFMSDVVITISRQKEDNPIKKITDEYGLKAVRYFHTLKNRNGEEGGRAVAVIEAGFDFKVIHSGLFNTKANILNKFTPQVRRATLKTYATPQESKNMIRTLTNNITGWFDHVNEKKQQANSMSNAQLHGSVLLNT